MVEVVVRQGGAIVEQQKVLSLVVVVVDGCQWMRRVEGRLLLDRVPSNKGKKNCTLSRKSIILI